jgi:hypothetical protein
MTRQTRGRLFGVLVLLVMLTAILATPSDQQAAFAVPCCDACEGQYEQCLCGNFYPECGGDPACCAGAGSIPVCRAVCNPDCTSCGGGGCLGC